jgi:PTH1 family peptidyl-tRNA hydrolase
LVIHDELDLPFGVIRLKKGGGEAGHKCLKSITRELGSGDYFRLRLGIGKDFQGDATNFVLEAVPPEQRGKVQEIVERAVGAVRLLIESGAEAAMNQTNRREKR